MAEESTAPPPAEGTEAPPPPADPVALQRQLDKANEELERWKADARKHEERAKQGGEAARKLRELEKSSMTDLERATATAREEAETAAARRWGTQLVGAEVRAAAAHLTSEQQAALVEAIDPAKFLTADGEVDGKAIGEWVARAYPKPDEDAGRPPGFPDLGQGARGGTIVPSAPESDLVALIRDKIGA